jgi:hypothetical protein
MRGAPRRGRAPEPALAAPAPEIVMHGRVEVVFHRGPLPRLDEAPLTEAELDFRWLIAGEQIGERVEVRSEFHEWSENVRLAWEAENIVWCHGYAHGKPIWRRERPPPEVEQPAPKASTKSSKSSDVQRFKVAQT